MYWRLIPCEYLCSCDFVARIKCTVHRRTVGPVYVAMLMNMWVSSKRSPDLNQVRWHKWRFATWKSSALHKWCLHYATQCAYKYTKVNWFWSLGIIMQARCSNFARCLKRCIDHRGLNYKQLPPASYIHTSPAYNMVTVRAGNYRAYFVNRAHPWLLLVSSHTHLWNSWKRTLLVWLCWCAYCNYVAFNCAPLTPSHWDALWLGTEISPFCFSQIGAWLYTSF